MPAEQSAARSDKIDAESLFRAHARFVAAFLQRLGAESAELDDFVQEVFLVAHRKGGYIPGPAKPRTWLAAIALRVASQGRRSQRQRRDRVDQQAVLAAVSEAATPAHLFEVRDSLSRVQMALDSLDLDHRLAFLLYEIEGETCPQIAAAVGVPIGTVYSRLHHARQRFMAAYARFEPDRPVLGALLLLPAGEEWIPPLRLREDSAVHQAMRLDLEATSGYRHGYDVNTGLTQLQHSMEHAAHAELVGEAAVPNAAASASSLGKATGFMRWVAAGRELLMLGAGTLLISSPKHEPPRIPVPVESVKEAPHFTSIAASTSLHTAPRPSIAPAVHNGPSALHREIQELGRIKTLVDVDPARAYRLTRVGQVEFNPGTMAQEREALAVLALWNTGKRPAALRDARAFVRRYPRGPMRERLLRLIRDAEP